MVQASGPEFTREVTEERSDQWKNEVVNASPNGEGAGKSQEQLLGSRSIGQRKIPTLEGLSCWLARRVPRGSERRAAAGDFGSLASSAASGKMRAGSHRSRCRLQLEQ